MNKLKKTGIAATKVIAVFFVLIICAFFGFRNLLLHKAIDKISVKLQSDYHTTFTIDDASFVGLAGIKMTNVLLVPNTADTILQVETIEASINFWYALIADFRLQQLQVKNGFVQLVKNENGRNMDDFLTTKDTIPTSTEIVETNAAKPNYAKVVYRLISKVLNLVPTHMHFENLTLRLDDMGYKVNMHLETLVLANKALQSTIEVRTTERNQRWNITGSADPRGKKADVAFFNLDTGKILIPYVNERFHLQCGFDSIRLNLESVTMNGDELNIKGFASIRNFMVNHPKIAKKDVVIEQARFDYSFLAGPNFICLDSSSKVQFNNVLFTPFIGFSNATDTIYEMHITIPNMQAQHFITSLPEGLFSHFKGMETMGSFKYRLDFVYNENKPQDLIFESNLQKDNLHIVKYGEANLGKLNGDFLYTPIENGKKQRSVLVSATNPYYTPINQISPYLQKCVLTTEDPSFFYHRGFIDEAFRQSIIKNIRKRKFARGASTISMQLVKNVFLTREKTISRKLEEILLVYILENNRISSKQRMLEVYFNVIEWGPNVYGIGEASQFYFQKIPIQLSLKECLFLATIIPRPKAFMWRFGKDGNLKPFAEKQFTFLTNLMLRREVLLPEDTLTKAIPLQIVGQAKGFIKIIADTAEMDSILIDENGRVSELLEE